MTGAGNEKAILEAAVYECAVVTRDVAATLAAGLTLAAEKVAKIHDGLQAAGEAALVLRKACADALDRLAPLLPADLKAELQAKFEPAQKALKALARQAT